MKDEIDIVGFLISIKHERKLFFRCLVLFSLIGAFFAFTSELEFSSSSSFIPHGNESSSNLGSGLGGLASIAGINLGGSGSDKEILPLLYPKVLNSARVKYKLINTKLKITDRTDSVTYMEYYDQIYQPSLLSYVFDYTVRLPWTLKSIIFNDKNMNEIKGNMGNSDLLQFSESELQNLSRISDQISVNVDKLTGLVSLSCNMPEPELAAQMTLFTRKILQQELILYRIERAKEELTYTEMLFEESKENFRIAQDALANFKDNNRALSTAQAQSTLQSLQSDYELNFSIYKELSTQLEQAKLKLNRNTPVFSIIEPVVVLDRPSSLSKPIVLIITILIGMFLVIIYKFIIYARNEE